MYIIYCPKCKHENKVTDDERNKINSYYPSLGDGWGARINLVDCPICNYQLCGLAPLLVGDKDDEVHLKDRIDAYVSPTEHYYLNDNEIEQILERIEIEKGKHKSLKELRNKNKLEGSIIYAKRENEIPHNVAQTIKDDIFHGFIEPLGATTLSRFYLREDEEMPNPRVCQILSVGELLDQLQDIPRDYAILIQHDFNKKYFEPMVRVLNDSKEVIIFDCGVDKND